MVTVRLFAILRERAGRGEMELELPEGATTSDALAIIAEQPGLTELVERLPLAMAVNRDYATTDQQLRDGDELALVPPVSGGAETASDPDAEPTQPSPESPDAPQVHALVAADPISAQAVTELVGRPHAGAIVTFQGTTRDVDRLDYEAYSEMAVERIEAILHDAVANHGLAAAAAEHRVGEVPLGEPSVVVAVSAAHRPEAFAGAREAIDRIKAETPNWKREIEITDRGESARWVEGALPAEAVRPPAAAAD